MRNYGDTMELRGHRIPCPKNSTVQSRTADDALFTAKFALDRVPEVVRRLFDACAVP